MAPLEFYNGAYGLTKDLVLNLYFFSTNQKNFNSDLLFYVRKNLKNNILLLWLSRFVSCSKFFPSVRYLFSQFSRAKIVPQKGHKLSAFGLELAQCFLSTVFLLSRTGKISTSHLKKKLFFMANLDNYRNKILFVI